MYVNVTFLRGLGSPPDLWDHHLPFTEQPPGDSRGLSPVFESILLGGPGSF